MNNKKLINLPSKYKDILDKIIKEFNTKDIENIAKKTIDYKRIFEIYNKINELLDKNDCGPYDINNMINNYNKKNIIIDILRKYIKLKNKRILSTTITLDLWKNYIKELLDRFNKLFTIKLKYNIIEKALFNLLKKYKKDWLGYWTIIETTKTGVIKTINLFDIEDLDNVLLFIAKNNNWKLKDKKETIRLQSLEKKIFKYII